jgi:hypothetical protein
MCFTQSNAESNAIFEAGICDLYLYHIKSWPVARGSDMMDVDNVYVLVWFLSLSFKDPLWQAYPCCRVQKVWDYSPCKHHVSNCISVLLCWRASNAINVPGVDMSEPSGDKIWKHIRDVLGNWTYVLLCRDTCKVVFQVTVRRSLLLGKRPSRSG